MAWVSQSSAHISCTIKTHELPDIPDSRHAGWQSLHYLRSGPKSQKILTAFFNRLISSGVFHPLTHPSFPESETISIFWTRKLGFNAYPLFRRNPFKSAIIGSFFPNRILSAQSINKLDYPLRRFQVWIFWSSFKIWALASGQLSVITSGFWNQPRIPINVY